MCGCAAGQGRMSRRVQWRRRMTTLQFTSFDTFVRVDALEWHIAFQHAGVARRKLRHKDCSDREGLAFGSQDGLFVAVSMTLRVYGV